MKEMKKKQEAIGWALNFAFDENVAFLRERGKDRIHRRIGKYLFGESPAGAVAFTELRDKMQKPGAMGALQQAIRDFFEENVLRVAQAARGGSKKVYHWFPPPPAEYYSRRGVYYDAEFGLCPMEWPKGSLEEIVVEQIVRLLITPPTVLLDRFLRCQECEGWFYHKRPKKFCSPRCNRRFNARKHRGEPGSEQRKTYNSRQAAIMQARYWKEKGLSPLRGKE